MEEDMKRTGLSRVAVKLAVLTAVILGTTAAIAAPAGAALPAISFTNLHYSNQCLDGSISAGVRLKPCNGGSYQQWYETSSDQLVNAHYGNYCLDGSISAGVRLNRCNSGDYQQWYTPAYSDQLMSVHYGVGVYCLDGSISVGVRLNDCNGGDYQSWNPF
jgi:hypothetical protein